MSIARQELGTITDSIKVQAYIRRHKLRPVVAKAQELAQEIFSPSATPALSLRHDHEQGSRGTKLRLQVSTDLPIEQALTRLLRLSLELRQFQEKSSESMTSRRTRNRFFVTIDPSTVSFESISDPVVS